jgi:hypothetical protein
MKQIKLFSVLLSAMILAGCHSSESRESLMLNPKKLETEATRCRSDSHLRPFYCEMVINTAEDFNGLINLRSANPEQFGQQIIETQQQLAVTVAAIKNVQSANPKDYKKIDPLKQLYQEQSQKLQMLLAVVAATSGLDD